MTAPIIKAPPQDDLGSASKTLSCATFDGVPFEIALSSNAALHHGATAGIYRGEVVGKQRLVVAVKVFGQLLGPVQRELLVREVKIARQVSMRHPFILAFIGTANVSDQQALVSLYMRNGNLMEYIKSNEECDKTKFILQVAEALDYLHRIQGLVHGDIKCANVLISDYGDALLADFGLSTLAEKTHSTSTTLTGIRRMHTARFAAPELLLGPSPSAVCPSSKTRQSDVYAFGMLVLEVITERAPWHELNDFAMMQQVCSGRHPPHPKSDGMLPSVSHAWWNVCLECWKFDARDRPTLDGVLGKLRNSPLDPNRILGHPGNAVFSVQYLHNGSIVCGCDDGSIRILDINTGKTVIGPIFGHTDTVACVAISPDGLQFATAGFDCVVRRWDAQSAACIGVPMEGHTDAVRCVAYSPDGARIVSGADDLTVRLWDASTGEPLGAPSTGHEDWVYSVTYSPDGSYIVSASGDTTIRVWDGTKGSHVATLTGHTDRVRSVRYSPDNNDFITGACDRTVRIWNLALAPQAPPPASFSTVSKTLYADNSHTSDKLRRTLRRAHEGDVTSVAVSPLGMYIASGSDDETICVWQAVSGDTIGDPLEGHTDGITCVCFSPDGRSLVSGSADGTVRIWDLFEHDEEHVQCYGG